MGIVSRDQLNLSCALHAHRELKLLQDLENPENMSMKELW